jgi:hypothetical protein
LQDRFSGWSRGWSDQSVPLRVRRRVCHTRKEWLRTFRLNFGALLLRLSMRQPGAQHRIRRLRYLFWCHFAPPGDVHRFLRITIGSGRWTRSSSPSSLFRSDHHEAVPLALRNQWCSSQGDALHRRPDREVKPRLGAADVAIGDDVASASASDHALSLVLLAHVDDNDWDLTRDLPGSAPEGAIDP